jgi:hypothetical protein
MIKDDIEHNKAMIDKLLANRRNEENTKEKTKRDRPLGFGKDGKSRLPGKESCKEFARKLGLNKQKKPTKSK